MNKEQLKVEIARLKREKRCVILAHYYTRDEVQEVADFVGDSLALARESQKIKADAILFAGVHFMAESAKVLSPEKMVLLPDLEAGCSLADSCRAEDLAKFKAEHPDHLVVSYVNTTAEVKALTDVVCTSSNAVQIVSKIDPNQPIIFGPDRNLGSYVKSICERENMLVWDGACHVHERFSLEKLIELKEANPNAKVLAHPECKRPLLLLSDHVGSTAALLEYVKTSDSEAFIVATEPGILYEMRRAAPEKEFIVVPPEDGSCACNDCNYMKLITLEKIYESLRDDKHQIEVEESIRLKAETSIIRMLELS